MRCKRCGELLNPADSHCPVCGKTVTPPRKKAPAQKPSETNIKLPQLDRFTHAYNRDTARSRMLQIATIGAILAAMVLTVMVFAGIGELKSAVKDLQLTADAQLQAMQNQPQVPDQTDPPIQTDPQEDPAGDVTEDPTDSQPTVDAPALATQNVKADLTLYNTADGASAAASMTTGDFDDRADAWVSAGRSGSQRRTDVAWILAGTGDRVDVTTRIILTLSKGPEPTEPPATSKPTEPPEVTKSITIALPSDKTEEYNLAIEFDAEMVVNVDLSPDTATYEFTLTGRGTGEYSIYIDGELLRPETVNFDA